MMRPIAYDVQDALREFPAEGLTGAEVSALLSCSEGVAGGALSGLYQRQMVRRIVERNPATNRPMYRYFIIPEAFAPSQLRKKAPKYPSPRPRRSGHSHAAGPSLPTPSAPPQPDPEYLAFVAYWHPLDCHAIFGATA